MVGAYMFSELFYSIIAFGRFRHRFLVWDPYKIALATSVIRTGWTVILFAYADYFWGRTAFDVFFRVIVYQYSVFSVVFGFPEVIKILRFCFRSDFAVVITLHVSSAQSLLLFLMNFAVRC